MIGFANYSGERVQIIELILVGRNCVALINYGGPIWVSLKELIEIELIDVEFSRITANKKGA